MVDYDKATGNGGIMRIKDLGDYVEFWIKAGSTATFANQMPWRYTINGSTSSWQEVRYPSGADWLRLGRWNITYDQTVTFYLGDTGTSGLGGPTTHSVAIKRATRPPAPSLKITSYSNNTINVDSNSNGTGGAPFLQWQIGYGTSSSNPTSYKDANLSTGVASITGLANGTTYYLWARVRNSEGWSAWSNRVSATTWNVPPAPSAVALSSITQVSMVTKFSSNGSGGSAVTEWQLGYGTSSTGPSSYATSSGTLTLTGLTPGTTYYFWARGKNSVGWGPWSARTSAKTIAGARVKVGTVWKDAIPYVRTGGVWKVAQPWARQSGYWNDCG